MMHHLNRASRYFFMPSLGLLLLRISTGFIFLEHGWMKIHNLPMVEGMMVHFGMGAWVGVFIAWLEVVGGLALILGILTRPFAVAFGIEMLVAFFLTGGFARGLMPHDLEIVLVLNSFALALAGSGRWALLSVFEHHRER